MNKLRVWWLPQVGCECKTFYIPVLCPEEGKKIMDILAAYDAFQLENNIKPDYSNCGGLEMFDETTKEWCDWYVDTENGYFDDVDNYVSSLENSEEIENFTEKIFEQINWNKIRSITK